MSQRPPRIVRTSLLALILGAALLLPACGAGATSDLLGFGGGIPDSSKGSQELTIATTSLPPASVSEPFPATQLQVVNAQGLVTWTLESGQLPPGLTLGAGGTIDGTPTSVGYFAFSVMAEDAVGSDSQALGIAVDTVGLTATAGLHAGDAWTRVPVTLTATGQSGMVSFSVVSTGSHGSLTNQDPAGGTATWTPGATGGAGVMDTIRVTDTAADSHFDYTLEIMLDPTETHAAAFGSSDVWWIDPTGKDGNHPFATDLHAALADIGLRASGSTNSVGTQADQLAELYFRVELLRQVNPMFLRNGDGTAGARGLPITFPFEEPGSGYTKPSAASYLSGSPTRYSQMAIVDGSQAGVIGTAFVDSAANDLHENDSTAGAFELGVFTNQITGAFNSTYHNALPGNPVNAGDRAALRALLYRLPNPGGRYDALRATAEGFARTVASVVAHEVGHSLGLEHTSPPTTGSIMNPSGSIHPSAQYFFTAADLAQLGGARPGVGRTSSSQKLGATAAAMAAGGVRVCHCRLANPPARQPAAGR